ncbi:MAG: hypothetical protein LBT38_01290 [Deltaproteobacteria bacterium]|jgi:hypothetical protein|nr:hypothetical protein [Deltaproteobacteria bacterium]
MRPIFWGLALALTLVMAPQALVFAQLDPSNRPLTVAQVAAELEARLNRQPSYATIWNAGYDLFRLHLTNQDTARVIHLGYMSVMGRGLTKEANLAIRQAAIYWQKVHDDGITNTPVGVDNNWRGQIYYGDGYLTTLKTLRPKSGPVPLRPNPKGRRRDPHKGRRDNPYPGPYYPGIYPP